ncbi:MAG: Spo0E family sporulation regulatory protein-aspartic acid phosphatase [Lachnospiraceae bacterium]
MNNLLDLQKEIENVRKELDVAVEKNVQTPECYQVSLQLDKLIEDYIQYKEKTQLLNCS